ncbi:MAG: hypothetical protein QNJ38_22695, partial [Prochloraceae cyanobacterium]|nr:hypothetical protein [Prochloraceae cyanobacterium]
YFFIYSFNILRFIRSPQFCHIFDTIVINLLLQKQLNEGRGQKAEGRGQRAEGQFKSIFRLLLIEDSLSKD